MTVNVVRRIAAVAALMLIGITGAARAQTQTVTYQVNAINQIAFIGAPSLTISTATAGSAPNSATFNTATWAVTTNQTGSKISASIASNMPTGLTLSVNLGAPTGGTSAGIKSLSTASVDLVTGVTKVANAGLTVGYTLDATVAADVQGPSTRLVTYTITGGT
jgi:Tfp pilus assembly protein PilV